MPIANCYIYRISVSKQKLETLTKEWADSIEVDLKDICLSFLAKKKFPDLIRLPANKAQPVKPPRRSAKHTL